MNVRRDEQMQREQNSTKLCKWHLKSNQKDNTHTKLTKNETKRMITLVAVCCAYEEDHVGGRWRCDSQLSVGRRREDETKARPRKRMFDV